MSDLISRGVLLKEIEEAAKSVEDARSDEDIKKVFLQSLDVVREAVIGMEPVYNVDKVIEKLEIYLMPIVGKKSKLYQTVLEIVKKGGV